MADDTPDSIDNALRWEVDGGESTLRKQHIGIHNPYLGEVFLEWSQWLLVIV